MTNRSITWTMANPVTRDFWQPTSTFPRNCRQCAFPSGTKSMNQGTEARLPDGSGASPR